MPLLKSFRGVNGYKDESAIDDVVPYPFNTEKGYMNNFSNNDYRNLLFTDASDEYFSEAVDSVIEQFKIVKKGNTRTSVNINHFVVSFQDIGCNYEAISTIKNMILNYFSRNPYYCQIFAVEHYQEDNLHVHFVVNHVGMFGKVFYGTDNNYFDLLKYLRKSTGLNWTYRWSDADDYE